MADTTCPPLGTGSVDFNALHQAAVAGEDLGAALAQATTRPEPNPEPEPEPESSAEAAQEAEQAAPPSKAVKTSAPKASA